MSLDGCIFVGSPATPAGVQQVLAATGSFTIGEPNREFLTLVAAATVFDIGSAEWSRVAKSAGFRGATAVITSNSDNNRIEEWARNCIRAAVALLHAYPASDLLYMEIDEPTLWRREGKLMLNNADGFWNAPEYLRLIDMPYEFGELHIG